MNIEYLEQLINSADKALPFLEDALDKKDKRKIQQAKVFLYSIYKQINKILLEKDKK